MTLRQILPQTALPATFKDAMRHLVGGVSVITAGAGEARTGLTVTSAISLSLDPPTMLVCVNRNASAWPVIQRERHYCVTILDARHQHIADRFVGRGGVKGVARYDGARWRRAAHQVRPRLGPVPTPTNGASPPPASPERRRDADKSRQSTQRPTGDPKQSNPIRHSGARTQHRTHPIIANPPKSARRLRNAG
jgi:hypothetical protein